MVDAGAISVTAHEGVVTLAGFVPSPAQKDTAEQQALSVAGVKALVETILIRSSIDDGLGDDEIARRIADMFRWSVLVPDDIAITVEAGWVTLTGLVDTPRQRAEANRFAAQAKGARGVINLVAVRNHTPAPEVQRRITAALRKQAEQDASTITVAIDNGQLVLRGEVAGWLERALAANVAHQVSGAGAIRNDILVRRPPGLDGTSPAARFTPDGC